MHAGGISAERHHTSIGRTTTTTTAFTGLKGTEGLKKLLLVFAARSLIAVDYFVLMLVGFL